MRVLVSALIGLTTLSAVVSPATAQTAMDKADARCILMLSVAAQDPKNRDAARSGSFFFLGRLNARAMSGKLGPLLVSETKSITTPVQAQAELARCGKELNARLPEMGAALAQVQQAGKAAAAQQRPPVK